MKVKIKNVKRLFLFLLFSSLNLYPQVSPQFLFPIKNLSAKLDSLNADSVQTLTFSVVGDLMCHSTQFEYARIDSDTFDFNPVFLPIKKYLSESDFTLGNLETVTAGKNVKYSGYPLFNTPDEFVEALANAGFDILFTANNHALDQGELGVKRTIDVIRKNGMMNVGSCKKNESGILFLKKNGIKFALLGYTFGTNGFTLPDSSQWCVNLITRKKIKSDLQKADSLQPDFIIVYFHFGTEYSREPDDYQKDYVNFAFRNGADIVLGSHPHVLQKIEEKHSKRIGKSFVAYSLGNFISNQRWRYSDGGVILKFSVSKNFLRKKTRLNNLDYIPAWVYKGKVNNEGKPGYRIYAVTDSTKTKPNPYFTDEDFKNMMQFYEDAKKILGAIKK